MISCLAEMPSKVDIAVLQVFEAAATARMTEKKKKRLVADAGPYELKTIRMGPARTEVRSTPISSPLAIPLAIPLVGGSFAEPVRLEAPGSSLSESARERIWPALLLGEARRFETISLHELGD